MVVVVLPLLPAVLLLVVLPPLPAVPLPVPPLPPLPPLGVVPKQLSVRHVRSHPAWNSAKSDASSSDPGPSIPRMFYLWSAFGDSEGRAERDARVTQAKPGRCADREGAVTRRRRRQIEQTGGEEPDSARGEADGLGLKKAVRRGQERVGGAGALAVDGCALGWIVAAGDSKAMP